MTKKKEEALSRADLTAKFKQQKKRLRKLKENTSSNTTSIEALEKEVADISKRLDVLMHNLRIVMRKLGLKPEFPGRGSSTELS